jgi:hypothetical protein
MVGPEARTADTLPEDRRPDFAVENLLLAARIILAESSPGSRPGVGGGHELAEVTR